jgi:hypothetical protein
MFCAVRDTFKLLQHEWMFVFVTEVSVSYPVLLTAIVSVTPASLNSRRKAMLRHVPNSVEASLSPVFSPSGIFTEKLMVV